MRAFKYATLLALASMTIACNEKITPKLLDANQSTTVPPIIEPSEYFFRVKNTSPSQRKFHLHQSGLGNYDKACEIKSTDKLDSLLYRSPRKAEFDISCIFEAEELGLNLYGFSFDIESSANTCETIVYSPFSFYNFQPGDSSASYTMVTCEEGTGNTHIAGHPARPSDASGPVNCGQMVLTAPIASTAAAAFPSPENEQTLCMYDYSQRAANPGPNCDIGNITINEITYAYTPPEAPEPATLDFEIKTRVVQCGGRVPACIEGPIKQLEGAGNATSFLSYTDTVPNENFKRSIKYERQEKHRLENLYYSNFRRNLANPFLEYGVQGNTLAYRNAFDNLLGNNSNRQYSPLLMENYAAGLSYNGLVPITINPEKLIMSGGFPTRYSMAIASEPFMANQSEYRTSPFYTFYCLDEAAEIRGRIKMVVRDWDRYFSTNRTDFELISDIYLPSGNSRMDNPFGVESPGDSDVLNPLNDIRDWDDFLRMTRSPGAYDPLNSAATIWQPLNGFNHSANFPQVTEEAE